MEFRDLNAQYQALKGGIDAGIARVLEHVDLLAHAIAPLLKVPRQGAWGQLGTVKVVPRRLGNCFSGVVGTYLLTTEMRSRM